MGEAENRITERIAKRREQVTRELVNHPFLSLLISELRTRMGAKLEYMESTNVLFGRNVEGVPVGMTKIEPKRRKK